MVFAEHVSIIRRVARSAVYRTAVHRSVCLRLRPYAPGNESRCCEPLRWLIRTNGIHWILFRVFIECEQWQRCSTGPQWSSIAVLARALVEWFSNLERTRLEAKAFSLNHSRIAAIFNRPLMHSLAETVHVGNFSTGKRTLARCLVRVL